MSKDEVPIKKIGMKIGFGCIFILLVPIMISGLTGVDLAKGCIVFVAEKHGNSYEAQTAATGNEGCIKPVAGAGGSADIGSKIITLMNDLGPLLQWFVILFTLAIAVVMFYGPGRDLIAYMGPDDDGDPAR